MNVVVASSRGFGLKEHLPQGTVLKCIPGGKLKTLTPLAKSLTPYAYKFRTRPHIYFLCGVPNISELIKSPDNDTYEYREVIFVEDTTTVIDRYQRELESAQREIIKHGALPIFATIPQFNIEIYNNHLLTRDERGTSYLHQSSDYKIMQDNLMTTIDQLNTFIYNLNRKVEASTPFLHDTIKECRGRKGARYYICKWNRLDDGLHAGDALKKKWANVLENCFRLNQEREEPEEGSSPKRSWKKCRFF